MILSADANTPFIVVTAQHETAGPGLILTKQSREKPLYLFTVSIPDTYPYDKQRTNSGPLRTGKRAQHVLRNTRHRRAAAGTGTRRRLHDLYDLWETAAHTVQNA